MPLVAAAPTRSTVSAVRFADLDALRGWAILGVLLVHCTIQIGPLFPGRDIALAGRYGVQLFFLVSAYTIFLTLDRARARGPVAWPNFFVRRFFRVLPMFWVGLALYAWVPGRGPEGAARVWSPLDYVLTAGLQHIWHPTLVNALVPGGWSIAVEGLFYLSVPLLYRHVRDWRGALWLFLGSLAVSEAAYQLLGQSYEDGRLFAGLPLSRVQMFAYMWFPSQFPVFACGILAYFLGRSWVPGTRGRADGALCLTLAGVLLLAAIGVGRHGWIAEHVFFALGFLPLLLGVRIYPTRLLVNPFLCLLGRVSYSLYLLHFAVLPVAGKLLARYAPAACQGRSLVADAALLATTLGLTLPLAWLTYRGVEQPFIRLGAWLTRRRKTRAESDATPMPLAWPKATARS